ncbi:MAG: hypothetical protein ACQERN_01970 [Thermodesulfobacteriota bacterium]
MKDIFKDVLGVEGVHGVIVLSAEGALLMTRFVPAFQDEESAVDQADWPHFLSELGDVAEAEFVFDQRRIYVRRSQAGFLLVVLDDIAPISMVRLNCEILLPALDKMKPGSSRIGQILKKRIF